MCGLVGIASVKQLTAEHQKVFSNLLLIDTLRGPHSTGVLSVDTDQEVSVIKKNVDGLTFLQTAMYDNLLKNKNKILAGHNRWATVGKVNYDNAHPFTHGPVTMMHNGTLKSKFNLEKGNEFSTDSETIAYNLSITPVDEVQTVIAKLNGAFALIWYDERDKSLNFIRNDERCLYLGTDSPLDEVNSETIVWASEAEMLELAVNRNQDKYEVQDIFLTDVLTHYKVFVDHKHIKWAEPKKYEPYVPKVTHNTYSYPSNTNKSLTVVGKKQKASKTYLPESKVLEGAFIDIDTTDLKIAGRCIQTVYHKQGVDHKVHIHANGVTVDSVLKELTETPFTKHKVKVKRVCQYTTTGVILVCSTLTAEEIKEIEQIESYVRDDDDDFGLNLVPGPRGNLVPADRYHDLTKDGCSWCTESLEGVEPEEVTWYGESPLCEGCKDIADPNYAF